MKKVALVIIALLFVAVGFTQNSSINVSVTDHFCCADDGLLQAERNGFWSQGTAYFGDGDYVVTFGFPLYQMYDTKVWGTTIDALCVLHDGGAPVLTYCYGEEEKYCGNPYPTTLDFDLHLNVLEYGTPGPPPPED